jgi:hypothetical protein
MQMAKVQHTHVEVEMDRTPVEVWRVVTDYATDTEWRKGIVEMTPDVEGAPQVGTNVREVLRLAARTTRPTRPSPRPGRHELRVRRHRHQRQGSRPSQRPSRSRRRDLSRLRNLIEASSAPA